VITYIKYSLEHRECPICIGELRVKDGMIFCENWEVCWYVLRPRGI
jgi:hypothetical protein